MATCKESLRGLVFVAFLAGCISWSPAPAPLCGSRAKPLNLRQTVANRPQSVSMSGISLDNEQLSRKQLVRGLAGLAVPLVFGLPVPQPANALADDVEKKLESIPLPILQAVAGGSEKEYAEMKDTLKPAKDLQGVDLALYKLYRYAATKTPATEDPRLSLRPLFLSKSGDALFQYVSEAAKLKVYDARGDGLTNQGKGGVLKGTKILLETLQKKGVIGDFTVDTSAHKELDWQQARPSLISVSVKAPVGLAAAKQLEEEKVGLPLSLVTQALQGYYKQCKIAVTPQISVSGEGEQIKLELAWAGKARQLGTMERRANDKLNAARGYKE